MADACHGTISRKRGCLPPTDHAATLSFEPIGLHLGRVAEEWSEGADHSAAGSAKNVGAEDHAVVACWRMQVSNSLHAGELGRVGYVGFRWPFDLHVKGAQDGLKRRYRPMPEL